MIRWSLLLLLTICSANAALAAVEGMSQRVFKAMDEAQELADAEDYDAALTKLTAIRKLRLTPYENAQVLRFTGFVYYQDERFDEALAIYEEALAQPRLPESMAASLLGSLGRLGLLQERYDYAESRLQELLAIKGHNTPTNQILLAVAYMRQEKFVEASEFLRSAIAAEREKGEQPRENWLSMLASAHYALEEYAQMREVLRELVEIYPRERYLMNLAALHGELGDRERQLALVESLLDSGRLEQESHLKMLANLFLAEGLHYKAASLLQAEIDAGRITADERNLELLSQAWYLTHELDKAVPALERAAELANSGKLYMRLAGLHMDSYDWEAADIAARKALEQGGLSREGNAWLTRGMARVRLNQLTEAVEFFNRAARFDDSRAYADQWLAYVANEQKILASQADSE